MKHNDCRKIIIIVLVFFLLIGVPVLLNVVLLKESPLRYVIGGEDAPREWLHFWGAYLAAIGSGSAAIVALVNERKNRKRGNLINQLNKRKDEYDKVEKEVKDNLDFHSLFRLTAIVKAHDRGNLEAENERQRLFMDLSVAIVLAERYYDLYPYSQNYLAVLKENNSYYLDECLRLGKILVSENDDAMKRKRLDETIKQVEEDQRRRDLNTRLFHTSLDFLHSIRKEILQLNDQLMAIK